MERDDARLGGAETRGESIFREFIGRMCTACDICTEFRQVRGANEVEKGSVVDWEGGRRQTRDDGVVDDVRLAKKSPAARRWW